HRPILAGQYLKIWETRPRYRYTGSALAANLAGVAGGALPPVIAGALVATYGSWAIGVMLAILALTSLVCTYRLPETAGSALVSR
ncbi:hypothetical protein IAR57_06275, partial [Mycobacterium canettii]|nr:hypothetical protein [Mycobacterium canetti]